MKEFFLKPSRFYDAWAIARRTKIVNQTFVDEEFLPVNWLVGG